MSSTCQNFAINLFFLLLISSFKVEILTFILQVRSLSLGQVKCCPRKLEQQACDLSFATIASFTDGPTNAPSSNFYRTTGCFPSRLFTGLLLILLVPSQMLLLVVYSFGYLEQANLLNIFPHLFCLLSVLPWLKRQPHEVRNFCLLTVEFLKASGRQQDIKNINQVNG